MEKLARVVGDDAAEDAARLLGAAEALRESIHAPLPPAARAEYEASVLALVLRLGEQGFEAARLEGRAMAPDQALAAVVSEEVAAPAP
jgi:hypothetical protein